MFLRDETGQILADGEIIGQLATSDRVSGFWMNEPYQVELRPRIEGTSVNYVELLWREHTIQCRLGVGIPVRFSSTITLQWGTRPVFTLR